MTVATAFMLSVFGGLLFFLIHWIFMTTWIITGSHGTTEFCRNRKSAPHASLTLKERFFSTSFACILGIVYTFVYVNMDDNSTYIRYFTYYSILVFENIIISILWISTPQVQAGCYSVFGTNFCYLWVIPVFCLVPCVIGVATMIDYYLCFHPSKQQKSVNES